MASCTSPTWRGSASSIRPKWSPSVTRSRSRVLKFDRERNRVSLGLKQLGADPWADLARVIRPTPASSARSPTSPTTAASSKSKRASKASCTSPKWTGPTRTSIRPRSCRSATKSKSWSWTSTRSAAASRSASSSASPIRGRSSRDYKKGDKVSGKIKSITDFGVFIGLPGGIDGLVHLSDHFLGRARRRSRPQLQEGRGGRHRRSRDRSGARAYLPRRQAARPGSVLASSSPSTRRAAS